MGSEKERGGDIRLEGERERWVILMFYWRVSLCGERERRSLTIRRGEGRVAVGRERRREKEKGEEIGSLGNNFE